MRLGPPFIGRVVVDGANVYVDDPYVGLTDMARYMLIDDTPLSPPRRGLEVTEPGYYYAKFVDIENAEPEVVRVRMDKNPDTELYVQHFGTSTRFRLDEYEFTAKVTEYPPALQKLNNVSRVELISEVERLKVVRGHDVRVSLQDEGQTLKVFIDTRSA